MNRALTEYIATLPEHEARLALAGIVGAAFIDDTVAAVLWGALAAAAGAPWPWTATAARNPTPHLRITGDPVTDRQVIRRAFGGAA